MKACLYRRMNGWQKRGKLPHLIAKYGTKCWWCGCQLNSKTLTIDHYIPLSKGGNNQIKNLRLACANCNNQRGNKMPEESLKTVRLPGHWQSAKYRYGQMVKQGQIIGMEYHPPGTKRACELGKGWFYTVISDDFEEDVQFLKESDIQLASTDQLTSRINHLKKLIDIYESNIFAVTEQIAEFQQEQDSIRCEQGNE